MNLAVHGFSPQIEEAKEATDEEEHCLVGCSFGKVEKTVTGLTLERRATEKSENAEGCERSWNICKALFVSFETVLRYLLYGIAGNVHSSSNGLGFNSSNSRTC